MVSRLFPIKGSNHLPTVRGRHRCSAETQILATPLLKFKKWSGPVTQSRKMPPTDKNAPCTLTDLRNRVRCIKQMHARFFYCKSAAA